MAIGSLKDLYFDELADLYDAERQVVRALPRLAEATHQSELRAVLTRHCEESRLHLERLDLIFTHWGERRPGSARPNGSEPGRSHPCTALSAIVQEADNRLHEVTSPETRDAAIIGAARRIEHYKMAAYGSARSCAGRLNRSDEARLLEETLNEEGRADRQLAAIADAHIEEDAAPANGADDLSVASRAMSNDSSLV